MSGRFLAGCIVILGMSIQASAQIPSSPSQGSIPIEAVGGVNLPGVPAAVTRAAAQAEKAARANTTIPETPVPTQAEDTNRVITIQPGATELVRVARGYLNHLITPFGDPKLLSVNPVEVKKEGSSLYIATSAEQPVGVYILSNDPADSRSISLTLIPARIPPTTLTLQWPSTVAEAAAPQVARRWEESAPYEEQLIELVQKIARGEIPPGYSLSPPPQPLPCALPGLQFFTGQRLTGGHFTAYVLRVTNLGHTPVELQRHAGCNVPGVVLVAPWPRAYLEPSASTELYVVVNTSAEQRTLDRVRPSLLGAPSASVK